MPGTNTQAYYENTYITAVKSFIVQAPEVFVPIRPLQPSLMFKGKARNLPKNVELYRCSTQAVCSLTLQYIRLGRKVLLGTNTLAY